MSTLLILRNKMFFIDFKKANDSVKQKGHILYCKNLGYLEK